MKKILILFSILAIIQIILAIICAPNSCEWGNEVYFYFGVGAILVSIFLPFIQKSYPLKKRIGFAILLPVIFIVLWIAEFMLFGFRIMCRMF
jgi:hypothetical protein